MEKSPTAAGLAVWKLDGNNISVLLCRLGGPYFEKKPCWTIPKGKIEAGENTYDTAMREFKEETGLDAPTNPKPLTVIKTPNGPCAVWYVEATDEMKGMSGRLPTNSNLCTIEWPPKSGLKLTFPETAEMEFFPIEKASQIIAKTQYEVLLHLQMACKKSD